MKFVGYSLIALAIVMACCTTTKQNDLAANVQQYLQQFEKNLALSDEVILKEFKLADKDDYVILKTVKIMQNKESGTDSITCTINFSNATIAFEDVSVRVDLTVLVKSVDPNFALEKETSFTLWLTAENDAFKITNWDVTNLYSDYHNAVYALKNDKDRAKELGNRKIFFDQANALSKTYDSVIWYSRYQDSTYYYVVNSSWKNYFVGKDTTRAKSVKMGLVSETGRVIVPADYELVGTIGFTKPGIIEVKKNGLVGHYSITGVELVPAQYDWIIPYAEDGKYALVKHESMFGWLDTAYGYHDGFPSPEAEQYIKEFKYLGETMKVSRETISLTEILHADFMGYGIAIPPVHFVQAGLLAEIIPHIYIGDNALYWGGTEYIESHGSLFKTISDKFSALAVTLTENYVEGREGFYEHNNITFLDNNNKSLAIAEMHTGELLFNKVDSTLLEVRIAPAPEESNEKYNVMDDDLWFAPYYKYFSLGDGSVKELESNRYYKFTEFVKMDSSYLKGIFISWDKYENITTRNFADDETIKNIRNEILASYGYIFEDPTITKDFDYRDWYHGKYTEYKEFEKSMTEIDRYNLEFLERIVGTLRTNPKAI